MLIDIFTIQHVEKFVKFVLEMMNFDVVDIQEYIIDNSEGEIEIEETEPINIHFDASGYQSGDAITNSGTVLIILAILPLFIGVMYLFSLCCCCARVRTCFRNRLKKTFFNGIIMFFEGIMLLVSTCAWINIFQVQNGVLKSTFSY